MGISVAAGMSRRPSRRAQLRRCVAVSLLVATAGACSSGGPSEYGDNVQREFVASCVEQGGEDLRNVCECTYDKISEQIPFERFEEIDQQIADQEADLPDDVIELITDCVIETTDTDGSADTSEVPTTTVPPTTVPSPPTAPPTTASTVP